MTSRPTLPVPSKRFGIGKDIGGAVYAHRSYEDQLGSAVAAAKEKIPAGFVYHVVKYNYRSRAVSFIQCPEFDTVAEPTVGDIVTVDAAGNVRRRRQPREPEVYHHKWLFVADDYEGFDVESSRQRSLTCLGLDGVDRRRIGRKRYWAEHILPRLDPT
jgi:hypothetical protein